MRARSTSDKAGSPIRGEFPIFERDLPQLVLAGGVGASRPRCRRGVALRLGRERRRVGLLGRTERGVSLGDRAPAPRRGGRRRRRDLGLAGRSALVSALPLDGERNRIVISEYEFPTVGRACAGGRGRGRPRPPPDREIPAERFAEAIDERTALVCCTTLSYRSGHRHDVGAIAEAAHAAGAIVLPTATRRAGRSSSTSARSARTWSRAGPSSTCSGRRSRFHVAPARGAAGARAHADGWFADEDIFAMSIADYSPHRCAGSTPGRRRCRPSTQASPDSLVQEVGPGDRGPCARSRRPSARRARVARSDGAHAARPVTTRAARLRALQ